jgi:peroxiredoxin
MSLTASTMLPLGTRAPDFSLPDSGGKLVSLGAMEDAPALLVVFMCNHCPYVQHIRTYFAALAGEFQQKGVAVVAINANDATAYPADSPGEMARAAAEFAFSFPYLYDESQEVARAYRAACTPDFFLFDGERKLVYRGQMDDSRPGNNLPLTGNDLRAAVDALLAGRPVSGDQKPSLGCNIKWKAGNAPDYFA